MTDLRLFQGLSFRSYLAHELDLALTDFHLVDFHKSENRQEWLDFLAEEHLPVIPSLVWDNVQLETREVDGVVRVRVPAFAPRGTL